jgi:urea transport system permease protein
MGWSGLRELPGFWAPFDSGAFSLLMVIVLPAVLAGGLGLLMFKGRVQGVYFSIITQALALIATLLFVGQQPYTGGTNGMTNFSTLFGLPLIETSTQMGLYAATVIVLGLTYLALRFLTRSRAGAVLVAIRDQENRLRFFGYDPALVKLAVFMLSASIAGIAGALFVPQVGIITPANMGIVPSIEMVIWVAVGGRGTLIGPIFGALIVNAAKSGLSESFPDFWQYFLGAMFVGAVVLFPDGVTGAIARGVRKLKGSTVAGAADAGESSERAPARELVTPLEAKS